MLNPSAYPSSRFHNSFRNKILKESILITTRRASEAILGQESVTNIIVSVIPQNGGNRTFLFWTAFQKRLFRVKRKSRIKTDNDNDAKLWYASPYE